LADERARTPKVVAVRSGAGHAVAAARADEGFACRASTACSTTHELAIVTGVPHEDLGPLLDKLEGLGLITFGPPQVDVPPRRVAIPPAPRQPAIDEDVDIDAPLREQSSTRSGVSQAWTTTASSASEADADKDDFKRAYFEYASVFHPTEATSVSGSGSFKARWS